MDRSDSEQEGVTLQPVQTMRLIARQEADRSIKDHLQLCPLVTLQVENRLRCVEVSLGRLIGFMLGSGILGGIAGGLSGKLFGG